MASTDLNQTLWLYLTLRGAGGEKIHNNLKWGGKGSLCFNSGLELPNGLGEMAHIHNTQSFSH